MATVTIEIKCATCGATAMDGWDFTYGDELELGGQSIRDAAAANEWRAEQVQGDLLTFCTDCAENGTADRMLAEYGWQREDADDADDADDAGIDIIEGGEEIGEDDNT